MVTGVIPSDHQKWKWEVPILRRKSISKISQSEHIRTHSATGLHRILNVSHFFVVPGISTYSMYETCPKPCVMGYVLKSSGDPILLFSPRQNWVILRKCMRNLPSSPVFYSNCIQSQGLTTVTVRNSSDL